MNKNSTIKQRVFHSLITFAVIPVSVLWMAVSIFTYIYIVNDCVYKSEISVTKAVNSINKTLESAISKGSYVLTNEFILLALKQDYTDRLSELVNDYAQINLFFSTLQTGNNNTNFIIYTDNPSFFSSSYIRQLDELTDGQNISLSLSSLNNVKWFVKRDSEHNVTQLYYLRKILVSGENTNILCCIVDFTAIRQLIDESVENEMQHIVYTDNNNDVLYATNPHITQNITASISQTAYSFDGNSLTVYIPYSFIFSKFIKVLTIISLLLIAVIVLIYISSLILSKKITFELNLFLSQIENNVEMISENKIPTSKFRDIAAIQEKFISLIQNIENSHQQALDLQKKQDIFELHLLQAKINPHLLYNSLSVLKWKFVENKDTSSADLIDLLIDYYRFSLSRGDNDITLDTEINLIEKYIKICEFCHSRRYSFIKNIDSSAMQFKTFKHILQPIVENAIMHGLNNDTIEGVIQIDAHIIDNHTIEIKIIDNGFGMPEETVKALVNMTYQSESGGYGFKNTIHRIQSYYGSTVNINIESEVNVGTIVTLKLPT